MRSLPLAWRTTLSCPQSRAKLNLWVRLSPSRACAREAERVFFTRAQRAAFGQSRLTVSSSNFCGFPHELAQFDTQDSMKFGDPTLLVFIQDLVVHVSVADEYIVHADSGRVEYRWLVNVICKKTCFPKIRRTVLPFQN